MTEETFKIDLTARTVEQSDGTFLAECNEDTTLYGKGDTSDDALQDLKDVITARVVKEIMREQIVEPIFSGCED
jgi:predicted RNase H-like HicB family nuclease